MKCFMKSFNSQKTALETKSASKNRAEEDYEVVDLNVTENTETTKNVPAWSTLDNVSSVCLSPF